LEKPSVAILSSVPKADRDMILKAINRKDCKFIKGGWINKFTRIHYHSDTKALGLFLEGLTKCPGVKVNVGFYRPDKYSMWAPENSNWSLFHHASENSFQIKIRLESDIDLTKLHIPDLKSTPVSKVEIKKATHEKKN